MFTYAATVVRVVDGDTVWLDVDLGLDIHTAISIRLAGINAPETSTPEGQAARDYLRSRLPAGTRVLLATVKDHREKYGRYLGTITLAGADLNAELVALGHAVPYGGGKR